MRNKFSDVTANIASDSFLIEFVLNQNAHHTNKSNLTHTKTIHKIYNKCIYILDLKQKVKFPNVSNNNWQLS